MDHLDLSPQALYERYDGRIRFVAGWVRYRHVELDTLLQAGRQGLLELRWRFLHGERPLPTTPFDRLVWSYVKYAIERAAHQQRPRLAEEARHDASLELLEDAHANPESHDFIEGAADLLGRVHAAALLEELSDDPDRLRHDETSPFGSDEPTPEQRADTRRARERVATAVAFLPRAERRVVEAHVFDELTFVAIAEQMQLSERWVREIYRSALRRLKETLAERSSEQRRVL